MKKIKFTSPEHSLNAKPLISWLLKRDIMTEEVPDDIFRLVPELLDIKGFNQNSPNHHLDVLSHSIYAISLAPRSIDVRLALLLHDIGKPDCYIYNEEMQMGAAPGHPVASEKICRVVMNRLGFSVGYINYICRLVINHNEMLGEGTVEKVLIANGHSYMMDLFQVQYADAKAHHPDRVGYRIIGLNKAKKEYIEKYNGWK